jgi:hypothetical protein
MSEPRSPTFDIAEVKSIRWLTTNSKQPIIAAPFVYPLINGVDLLEEGVAGSRWDE